MLLYILKLCRKSLVAMSQTPDMASVRQDGNPVNSSLGWFVWSLAAISFGYAFFHRVAPSVMVSELMGEFGIGGAMLGTLSALYFYPYVLLQIPLGALLEQFGTRLLLSGALVITAVGTFLFSVAEVIEFAYIGRVLIGIGSSVAFLGALALAATWYPASRRCISRKSCNVFRDVLRNVSTGASLLACRYYRMAFLHVSTRLCRSWTYSNCISFCA